MSEQSISIRKAYRPELTVLLVEDHMMFSKDIKHALPQHTVVIAQSLEDAKTRYDECLPDVVFLDLDLPDGNGLELLDYIHTKEPEIYAVILTGSKLPEDIEVSRSKGARGYIIKPFTRAKIEQYIEEYLQNRKASIQSLLLETEKNRQVAQSTKTQ